MNPTEQAVIKMARRLETQARRKRAQADGKCQICFTKDAEENRSRCEECGAYQRAYGAARRAKKP